MTTQDTIKEKDRQLLIEFAKFVHLDFNTMDYEKEIDRFLSQRESREEKDAWISVDERLPERSVDVWTWDGTSVKRGHLAADWEVEFYEEASGETLNDPLWDDAEWFGQSTKITHWQPYTEPAAPVEIPKLK